MTLCLIVTYQHHDDPTAPPTSDLQRVIDLGQAGAIRRRQFDRAVRQIVGSLRVLWEKISRQLHPFLIRFDLLPRWAQQASPYPGQRLRLLRHLKAIPSVGSTIHVPDNLDVLPREICKLGEMKCALDLRCFTPRSEDA